jgi:2-keto-4-pentenoate hydratase/2-oxohepta-3-ene-1,7-dioic acid hydratase in catechol pathway
MAELLSGGEGGLDVLRRIIGTIEESRADEAERLRARGALQPLTEIALAAAVPRPGILLSHGSAYRSHLNEMNASAPSAPRAFLKNTNCILAPEAPIVLPPQASEMVDFEAEFSIVFGAVCHNVSEAEALAAVAGYTIINDVSARNWVSTDDMFLNIMGKQLPTFAPLGPFIVTKDEVANPHDLSLTTRLNGKVMQAAHTSDLIWPISRLISYFSRWYPFRPGDILTTGTPAGVGFARKPPVFMGDGDVVEITVEKVGTLRNPIVGKTSA